MKPDQRYYIISVTKFSNVVFMKLSNVILHRVWFVLYQFDGDMENVHKIPQWQCAAQSPII